MTIHSQNRSYRIIRINTLLPALGCLLLAIIFSISGVVSQGKAQIFVDLEAGGSIPDGPSGAQNFFFDVHSSDIITDVDIRLTIAHPFVNELTVKLTSPNEGTEVILIIGLLQGVDLRDTYLDDEALVTIGAGGTSAPYSGSYRPVGYDLSSPIRLSDFDGENPMGMWTLRILDGIKGDTGTIYAPGDDAMWGPALGTQLILNTPSVPTPVPEPEDYALAVACGLILFAGTRRWFASRGKREAKLTAA